MEEISHLIPLKSEVRDVRSDRQGGKGSEGATRQHCTAVAGRTTCPPRFSVLAPSLQVVNVLPNYFIFVNYNVLFFLFCRFPTYKVLNYQRFPVFPLPSTNELLKVFVTEATQFRLKAGSTLNAQSDLTPAVFNSVAESFQSVN